MTTTTSSSNTAATNSLSAWADEVSKQGTKRTYTRAQLQTICPQDLDPKRTAEAVVAEVADDLQAVAELGRQVKHAQQCMEYLATELRKAKRAKHGETFRCSACNKYWAIEHAMKGAANPPIHHTIQCFMTVCYECAMKSPTACPVCKLDVECWLGGPKTANYVIVSDMRKGTYGRIVRLEGCSVDTTVRQLREKMGLEQGVKVRIDNKLCGNKMDKTLAELGVSKSDAEYRKQGFYHNPCISVNTK